MSSNLVSLLQAMGREFTAKSVEMMHGTGVDRWTIAYCLVDAEHPTATSFIPSDDRALGGGAEPLQMAVGLGAEPRVVISDWRASDTSLVIGQPGQRVSLFPILRLNTPRLFSSRVPDFLLVYKDEFLKANWTPAGLDSSYCRIIRLKNIVEANGRTRFILLIVPDKLTAYGDYLVDKKYLRLTQLSLFLDSHHLPAPRVDHALSEAIGSGQVDVYLPNDSHWGSAGHRIVGGSVATYIPSIVSSAKSQ